jgi:hypothetical protein
MRLRTPKRLILQRFLSTAVLCNRTSFCADSSLRGVLVQSHLSSRLLQQVLAELFAKHPETPEERAAINAAIAEISRALLAHGLSAAAAPRTSRLLDT